MCHTLAKLIHQPLVDTINKIVIPMQASIITIGDEILIGQVVDTNSSWISRALSDIGIAVKKMWSVGDESNEIILGLDQALAETDILFITGGLGPTKDDITKKTIASYLGQEMVFHEATYQRIVHIFQRLDRPMSPSVEDQCWMPAGAEILHNSMGTAPGMWFDHQGKIIISMPGVPYEMKSIMHEVVLPRLATRSGQTIIHKTILTACTGETIIENKISGIISQMPAYIKVAYLPSIASVRVRLSGIQTGDQAIINEVEHFKNLIVDVLGDIVYGFDDSSLENEILKICLTKNVKVSTAESCTGGAIAAKLVTIPGSSAYFHGGIVAYDNVIKEQILKVNHSILTSYRAVSEQTVIAMVKGGNQVMQTDVCVSISGIAGPDGGSLEKPVGTMWICVGNTDKQTTFLLKAGKDRIKNIETATIYALANLRKFILENY